MFNNENKNNINIRMWSIELGLTYSAINSDFNTWMKSTRMDQKKFFPAKRHTSQPFFVMIIII